MTDYLNMQTFFFLLVIFMSIQFKNSTECQQSRSIFLYVQYYRNSLKTLQSQVSFLERRITDKYPANL